MIQVLINFFEVLTQGHVVCSQIDISPTGLMQEIRLKLLLNLPITTINFHQLS